MFQRPRSLPSVPVETFEGPLDFLLDEVRRQNIAIEQVALAPLVARYLAYMRAAASHNVNLDIEWVHMAATLIHDELVQLLSAHRHQVARDLARLQSAEGAHFCREAEKVAEVSNPPFLNVWDLMQQAREFARWAYEHRKDRTIWSQMVGVEQADSTVSGMTDYLLEQVTLADGQEFDALGLLYAQTSGPRRACLFLAMLEIARDRHVDVL